MPRHEPENAMMSVGDRQAIPQSRRVQLMLTCLCDAFFDDVAKASVEVLEHLGCEVEFPDRQTCCGQPAFNAGDWQASRKVVRHGMDVFAGDLPIVVPSASCAAMYIHGAPLEFESEPDLARVRAQAARTWEIADFIVHGLGVDTWPGHLPLRLAFHTSCHSRGSNSGEAARRLLGSIDGIELLPVGESGQCCGFGGAFSVTFPNISGHMGELKLQHVMQTKPDYLVSGDMGCLFHLGGMLDKKGQTLERRHLVQILRDALVNARGDLQ